jgi:DNA repair protein RadC
MLLNRANLVLGLCNLSFGSTIGTIIDTRMVFAAALKGNATSIIVAHNHPSENLQPSNQDRLITAQLREAGKFMNIPLVDHIIMGRYGYYSFADEQDFACDEEIVAQRSSETRPKLL